MALALQELRGALLVFVILLAMFTDHASEKCAEVRPQRGGKGQTADSLCVAFQQRAHGGCPLILLGRSICPLISQMWAETVAACHSGFATANMWVPFGLDISACGVVYEQEWPTSPSILRLEFLRQK